jgi:hypothetical protein
MHLYGYLLRIMPAPAAGVVFALVYAGLILVILVLTPMVPADFDYGGY